MYDTISRSDTNGRSQKFCQLIKAHGRSLCIHIGTDHEDLVLNIKFAYLGILDGERQAIIALRGYRLHIDRCLKTVKDHIETISNEKKGERRRDLEASHKEGKIDSCTYLKLVPLSKAPNLIFTPPRKRD